MSTRPIPEVCTALRGAESVLFVCSGNMVRSAFAELYARHRGIPIQVSSVATTFRNDAIFPETADALLERGVAHAAIRTFRPTHLDDLPRGPMSGTVAFGMTLDHLDPLPGRTPAFLLRSVVGNEDEIPDPVMDGADFGRTFECVAECVDELVRFLNTE